MSLRARIRWRLLLWLKPSNEEISHLILLRVVAEVAAAAAIRSIVRGQQQEGSSAKDLADRYAAFSNRDRSSMH